ncbi:helicase sen1 isoform X2 [Manduca sexta]|uniref:FHA domain-containing protein n=1 Tax=Manduca sexta TaxID=7130 RepID=A0A921YSS9_MANSE|nr:helicase sen1 isoform X2 [Manduca sexta]KAG6444839.1 hypothetical protein O3G_MSEX003500 [Manduca sexta]
MATWKLTRQIFGNEEYTLSEGDVVTIGRSTDNTITLCSMVVSRNHCSLKIERNQIMVTDLKSSNGVFVGSTKIPPNVPYIAKDSDTIGIGWDTSISSTGIDNTQKYLFKVARENKACHDIERRLSGYDSKTDSTPCNLLKENSTKAIKRKADFNITPKKEKEPKNEIDDEIIHIKSESDNENLDSDIKKPKLEPITETPQIRCIPIEKIKNENEYLQLEAFNVKQEYLAYDDEPIEVDSDSDRESEQWLARLSQNSPGKPLKRLSQQNKEETEDSSYSQLEDFVDLDNLWSKVEDDVILIEPSTNEEKSFTISDEILNFNDHLQDEIENNLDATIKPPEHINLVQNIDEIDGFCNEQSSIQKQQIPIIDARKIQKETKRITQLTEPPDHPPKKQSTNKLHESKTKSSSSKRSKSKKESTSRRHISKSDKEARKQKLKELAIKEREKDNSTESKIDNSSKSTVHAKVTATSRSAFLGDTIQIVKPLNRKEKNEENSKLKNDADDEKKIQSKDKKTTKDNNNRNKSDEGITIKHIKDSRVPLKNVKPLSDREDVSLHEKTILGKPFNKVEPLSHKQSTTKKTVRFSDAGPKVHVFEIEPGNKMKKIQMMKTTLLDVRHVPMFSLDKIALMKILRWNPQWLEEQINNDDCPPILGHNKQPMSIFHSFSNHAQYAQQIGDLLLMEIWECLTIAYMKVREQRNDIVMRIENIPPAPPLENSFDLLNISVNVSVPSSEAKKVPRVGAILLVIFGPENARCQRFFSVHNVRCLPSPPSNMNSFFSLSLQSAHSEKILSLRQGEVVLAKTLAHISNELMLFEAMEYMANSPLGEIILQPKPYHFPKVGANPVLNTKSPWTMTLNPSQQMAVNASVSAALSDRPSVQMVQGPPGTGKSSVICSMVMSYFYDSKSRRNQNHGKILICATSNAAVDELVIRLLKIRQTLPKEERFRMVRVGRAEAMHPCARDVSSQQLARRDHARAAHHAHAHHAHHAHHAPHGLAQEISHLEAKMNMWKAAIQDAKDPVRVAYCQSRMAEVAKRLALVRQSGGLGTDAHASSEALAHLERVIVEGADIVVTTLASAYTHKTKVLKRRIALCIIDEAGQAIEPETLIPLMLDVTHLTLIGDPQQLPGFICSQRAKKHGLGESLFARLTSSTEQWAGAGPVVLLDRQYRMHPDIIDYPNRAFYDCKIKTVAPQRPPLNVPPYSIISISSGNKGQGSSGGNELEAMGVARLALALSAGARAQRLSLAVVTPYHAHKDLIRKNLAALHQHGSEVEVNTADSFQGQERDVIVVSLARSQGVGFLTHAGRMNVMLTRARHALLICLNPHAMMRNDQWRTLIEDAQRRNMFKSLPTKLCKPLSPDKVPTDDILKYLYPNLNE